MKFGLTDDAIKLINSVFMQHPEVKRVQVFGSRALGTQRENSDIDLVIWGDIDNRLLAKINAELDELALPYLFDIQCYGHITHDGLKDHIKQFAKDLYSIQ